MELEAVSIDDPAFGAYGRKIKTLLAFANEIFHVATVAVIAGDLPVAHPCLGSVPGASY